MLRLTRCSVLFGVLAGIWACSGDPTNNTGKPTFIVADPAVLFVPQGLTVGTIVSVVDEDGQSLASDFTVSNVGAGLTVFRDANYLPTQTIPPTDIGHQARFVISADAAGTNTFTVNASGLTKTVTVNVTP
jgi:hypothetical protein